MPCRELLSRFTYRLMNEIEFHTLHTGHNSARNSIGSLGSRNKSSSLWEVSFKHLFKNSIGFVCSKMHLWWMRPLTREFYDRVINSRFWSDTYTSGFKYNWEWPKNEWRLDTAEALWVGTEMYVSWFPKCILHV